MDVNLISIEWQPRSTPLQPTAVAATGASAVRLGRRLLLLEDEALAGLQGVAAEDSLLIMGNGENLPWTKEAVYLGRDNLAPSILLPTVYEPTIPAALLERALMQRFKDQVPFAVLLDPGRIISFGGALQIKRTILQKWLGAYSQNFEQI